MGVEVEWGNYKTKLFYVNNVRESVETVARI